MFKNVASQKIIVFAFDSTTNTPKTGDSANITAYISKDFGAVTVLGDTTATEMDATNAKGYYLFDITQTETNADVIMVSAKSSTANIVVVGAPATIFTLPANFTTQSIDSNGRVDVIKIAGTTQTARDIGASVLLSAGTGTGQLDFTSGVVKGNVTQWLGSAPNSLRNGRLDAITNLASGTAQAGAAGTITLAAGASATTDLYKGQLITLDSSTGSPQTRLITAYDGSTKIATIVPNWTTNPGASSTYIIHPWGYGLGFAAAAIQSIWDALTSALTTASSIGKLLVDKINPLPTATAGAANGLLIAGNNAATTFTGTNASGSTPATAGLTCVGGAASTTGGGIAAPGIKLTGGAGAASTNGAGDGLDAIGGSTTTVRGGNGVKFTATGTGSTAGEGLYLSGAGTRYSLYLDANTNMSVDAGSIGGNDASNVTYVGDFIGTSSLIVFDANGYPSVDVQDWKGATAPAMTGDAFARLGVAGAGLTALGDTRLANLDATVSSRLASASYTTPLDAAGTRSAVGLAAANLDTQIATLATSSSLSTVGSNVDAIKAKSDQLTFTVANHVDSNIQYVNDVQVTGDGQTGTEWGPA